MIKNEIGEILSVIEDNKQNIKDCDYIKVLELLSKLNNKENTHKSYYLITFHIMTPDLVSDMIDVEDDYINLLFYIQDELFNNINGILEDEDYIKYVDGRRSQGDIYNKDCDMINGLMCKIRPDRIIYHGDEDDEFTLKSKVHIVKIIKQEV